MLQRKQNAYLCHIYGVKEEWLAASKSCIDFLEEHCVNHEAGGRLYFTVTGDGKPLRQRRYCYSEAFYCIANAEYYGITGEKEHLERARRAYDMYWNLNHGMPDPTGMGPKTIPETRTGRSLGIPMIILNVTGVIPVMNVVSACKAARKSFPTIFATPKSDSTAWPSASTSTFSSFTSRCTTPCR